MYLDESEVGRRIGGIVEFAALEAKFGRKTTYYQRTSVDEQLPEGSD